MQAITSKYLPATDTLGSRIKATSGSGTSVTVPYDHEAVTDEAAHWRAVHALLLKLDWARNLPHWHGGWTQAGMVWVAGGQRAYSITED